MLRIFRFKNSLVAGVLSIICAACTPQGDVPEGLYERTVEGNVFETVPVRGAFLPLRNRRTNFEYKCSECHTGRGTARKGSELQAEHALINKNFNHGVNTDCLNCHHPEDRNAYVAHDGTPIPATEPARLCGKCHGPTYRDWQEGVHGRQNGYWDTDQGPREKLVCIQCHDPHNPKFKLMTPDAPPIRSRLDLDAPEHESAH